MKTHIYSRPLRFAIFVLFLSFVVSSSAADTTDVPAPPMQGKPWTPPETTLPPVVVSAVTEIFDQGMADPRGCEYREVVIKNRLEGFPRKVHAWVLPGDGKTRYAVGWNGRVNAVDSIGDPVDLRKDFPLKGYGELYEIYNRSEEGIMDMATASGGGGAHPWVDEHGSLSESSILPIKVALLLRLGEPQLAEGVWKKWKYNQGDPYLDMAREWLISWFIWTRPFREQGDRSVALEAFHKLAPLKKAAEASAARRKLPFPIAPKDPMKGMERPVPDEPGTAYFEELEDLPAFLVDEERRVNAPAVAAVTEPGLQPPQGPEHIATLIEDLDQTRWLLSDPILHWLIREGEPAVEPLIKCLQNDDRLTMSGSPVYAEAYMALAGILKLTPEIPLDNGEKAKHLTKEQRKALAGKFLAYWNAQKGVSLPDRWFSVLLDDHVSPTEWAHAARNITERIDSWETESNMFSSRERVGANRNASGPMRGESLRAKKDPSLDDLLAKRIKQLDTAFDEKNPENIAAWHVLQYARDEWNLKPALK